MCHWDEERKEISFKKKKKEKKNSFDWEFKLLNNSLKEMIRNGIDWVIVNWWAQVPHSIINKTEDEANYGK